MRYLGVTMVIWALVVASILPHSRFINDDGSQDRGIQAQRSKFEFGKRVKSATASTKSVPPTALSA